MFVSFSFFKSYVLFVMKAPSILLTQDIGRYILEMLHYSGSLVGRRRLRSAINFILIGGTWDGLTRLIMMVEAMRVTRKGTAYKAVRPMKLQYIIEPPAGILNPCELAQEDGARRQDIC